MKRLEFLKATSAFIEGYVTGMIEKSDEKKKKTFSANYNYQETELCQN